ncbi:hypothetical protein, partial [Allorhizocola rhizosphaerae]|uniref:hypothetical protein n=1 Tax=Allorhizocola rhizosphaerae TaxID=1872709 RepID=UPI0013C2B1F6
MAGVRTVSAPLVGPWTTIDGSEGVAPVRLLAVAGAGASGGRHVTLAHPRIRRLPGDERVLSITFVLSRAPDPHEPLAGLVQEAVLGLEAEVTPPPELCERLTAKTGVEHVPLFVRRTSLRLTNSETGRVLAETTVDTQLPALSATLDRTEALALLDAVAGRPGPLSLELEAGYRAADEEPGELRLEFDLGTVWNALSALVSGDDVWLSGDDLSGVLAQLIRDGSVLVSPMAVPVPDVVAELMGDFERALRPILHSTRAGYELTERPPDGTLISLTHRYQNSGGLATVRLPAPMHEVLREALAGTDPDRYVKPVTVGTGGLGTVPVPKLVHSKSRPAPPAMVLADGRVTTAWNAARPAGATLPAAHAVLAASRPDLL